jgi:hypothetical protein
MPAAAREDEFGPPGAGTYYVYGQVPAVDEAEWDKLVSRSVGG